MSDILGEFRDAGIIEVIIKIHEFLPIAKKWHILIAIDLVGTICPTHYFIKLKSKEQGNIPDY